MFLIAIDHNTRSYLKNNYIIAFFETINFMLLPKVTSMLWNFVNLFLTERDG